MKIDGKFLRGEPLERWFPFWHDTATGETWRVLLRYPRPAEWQEAFKGKSENMDDPKLRAFVAEHVVSWDTLEMDGEALPCTPDNVLMFMREDGRFATWLLSRLADTASFRSPARDGAARPAGDVVAPAPVGAEASP